MADVQSNASTEDSDNASDTQSSVAETKEVDPGLTKGGRALWEQGLLLDYTIEVEDEQFRVHKFVMAAVSDYFKAMLTGGMAESQTDRVTLHGLNPLAVSSMIQFAYTGQFGDNTAGAEDMFACAVYFLMPPAVNVCAELLVQELDNNNCFDRLSDFQSYHLQRCILKTEEYIYNNLDDILDTIEPNEMSFQGFNNLLKFWPISEWYLFLKIKEWVDTDSENRIYHLNELMCQVRFGLMTPTELANIQRMDIYLESEGPWGAFVNSAEEYHNLPIHLKVLDDSDQAWVRSDQYPVCFTADTEPNEFYTLDEEDNWLENTALQTPVFRNGVSAVVQVNNFLIVCDQFLTDHKWYIFDPRNVTWSSMASMSKAREAFALAHHGDHLYAFGGINVLDDGSREVTNRVERYNFHSNTWSIINFDSPPLPRLHKSSACALEDGIYILGGWETIQCDDRLYSDQLYCYDPSTDTWDTKPPIEKTHPSYKMLAMENDGESVLLVISNLFDLQIYRPGSNKWGYMSRELLVDTRLRWQAAGTILANKNNLYLLNFIQTDEEAEGEMMFGIRFPADKSGGCIRWTLANMWPKDKEEDLGDFPISPVGTNDSERMHFCALLAFPLGSVVRSNRAA